MLQTRLLFVRALGKIDQLVDSITSYRLLLYFLLVLIGWATALGFTGQLPFKGQEVLISSAWLVLVCLAFNRLLARFLNISTNQDSDIITALILALIMSPASTVNGYAILAATGFVAMASKYILVYGRRHIFNPAAFGAAFAGVILNTYASWWVGTNLFMPLIIIGGILILRKMKRATMVSTFLVVYLLVLVVTSSSSSHIGHLIWLTLASSSLLFFAFVMLTEPLTSPYNRRNYLIYAGLVAILYGVPKFHISPEEALLIGNLVAFALEPTKRLQLSLVRRQKEANEIYSYFFSSKDKLKFQPGQYMEWTLPRHSSDSRGNRRYLTVASSPTEPEFMFTVRMPNKMSSYKKHLSEFKAGDKILASHIAGSFTLPKDEAKKIVLVAGGVGITPFRSIVKYLVDTKQTRDITLLYAANSPDDFAFSNLFKSAEAIGLKTLKVVTNTKNANGWDGLSGPINNKLVSDNITDLAERTFYISGPYGFVASAQETLIALGVPHGRIITDYFPGYS